MVTKKVMGCGGRYSFASFYPCSICLAETEDECKQILKVLRTEKHEEWHTVR